MKKILILLALTTFLTGCERNVIGIDLFNKMGNHCKSNGGIEKFEFYHLGYINIYCKDTAEFTLQEMKTK